MSSRSWTLSWHSHSANETNNISSQDGAASSTELSVPAVVKNSKRKKSTIRIIPPQELFPSHCLSNNNNQKTQFLTQLMSSWVCFSPVCVCLCVSVYLKGLSREYRPKTIKCMNIDNTHICLLVTKSYLPTHVEGRHYVPFQPKSSPLSMTTK